MHIPVTMGAVSVGYNLPVDNLKLDAATMSGIYLGTITKWNDPKIAALNHGATLPSLPIVVVHRSEGSGTTFIFTSYLAAVSPEWKSKVGAAGAVRWPAGIGAKGSEGVSGQVTGTPGAVGYFELAYAKTNNIKSALLKNKAGKFVEPSVKGAADAGAGAAANMPADLKAVFVNAPGATSYPIAGFSWIVAFKDQKDPTKGKALVDTAELHGDGGPAVRGVALLRAAAEAGPGPRPEGHQDHHRQRTIAGRGGGPGHMRVPAAACLLVVTQAPPATNARWAAAGSSSVNSPRCGSRASPR